jgi:hypothetical protein
MGALAMIYAIISFYVLLFLCVAVVAYRSRPPENTASTHVYRYSRGIATLVGLWTISWTVFLPLVVYCLKPKGRLDASIVYVLLGFTFVAFLGYARFSTSHVIVQDGTLVKREPFRTTAISLSDIRKVIVQGARDKRSRGATRLYGKKKVTLEGIIEGYDDLLERILASCKNAEVIEK